MKVSIIICTYNRAENLKNALDSIMKMHIPKGLLWEIIIVDNHSKDNTKAVVEDFKINSGLNVVYIFEKRRGLSNARNCGVRAAKGEIVAFTDDDAIVDPSWLISMLKEFESDASLAGLGGRVELYDKNDKPVTIRTFKERIPFSSIGQLFRLIPGNNMAFERKVFDEIGEFDPTFGAGTRIQSAEDSDFLYRAYRKGFKMVYSPDVLIYHNHGRKTDAQVQALNKGYVVGRGAFYCKHILKGDGRILKLACGEVYSLMRGFIRGLRSGKPVDTQRRYLWALLVGAIYNIVGMRPFKGMPPFPAMAG